VTEKSRSARRWLVLLSLFAASCLLATPSVFAQCCGTPSPGSNQPGANFTFSWSGPTGPAYNYEFTSCNALGNWGFGYCAGLPPVTTNGYLYQPVINMPDDGESWNWWVRMIYNGVPQGWVYMGSFVNGPSGPPAQTVLSAPAIGSTQSSASTIRFTWNGAARATAYEYQLSLVSTFPTGSQTFDYLTGCCDYTLGPTTWYWDIGTFDNLGRTWYWRMRASNVSPTGVTQWGPWSSASPVWSFINGTKPGVPTLTYPLDGTGAPTTWVPFDWNSNPYTVYYHLQVAKDSGFTNIFYDQTLTNTLFADVTTFLDDGTKYWWRIGAKNYAAGETFSAVRTFFNTITTCTPSVGSGVGTVAPTTPRNLDTCFVNTNALPDYYLHDVSRRTGGSHGGRMPSTSFIQTRKYFSTTVYELMGEIPRGNSANDVWDDSTQAAGVDAHAYTELVYDYLNLALGLNSFDNLGSSMVTRVDVPSATMSSNFDETSMIVTFSVAVGASAPLEGSLDMVGHEWGHGVTRTASTRGALVPPWGGLATKGLFVGYESGALDEAFSDWIGTAAEWYYGEQNWTIGEGSLVQRNMADPPSLSQPDTYQGLYYQLSANCAAPSAANDFCGVRTNAGVPDKMFYLLSAGGTHPVSNITVQGIGIQNAMAIALRANLLYWRNGATFQDALAGMVSAANDLHPNDASYANAVKNAWAAVGVGTLPHISASASPTGSGNVTGAGNYPYGASVTLTATANSSTYRFVNWTENGTEVGTSTTLTFTANGNRTLVANYSVPNISVSPALGDFGHVVVGAAPPTQTFTVTNAGAEPLLMGSVFVGGGDSSQFVKSSDGCSGLSIAAGANCTVDVQFVPSSTGPKASTLNFDSNDPDTAPAEVALTGTGDPPPTFTITATAQPGGSISPSGTITVAQGGSQTFTITPDTCFYILKLVVDGQDKPAATSYTISNVTANRTIEADFALIYYTITASSGSGGTISPPGVTYVQCSGSQSYTSTGSNGNSLLDIVVDGVSKGPISPYPFTNVTMNHTISASFASPLTLSKSGSGTGTVTSSPPGINCGADCNEPYPYGTVVTLTATASTGSLFAGWSGGGCGGTGTCTLTMTTNMAVIAYFNDTSHPPASGATLTSDIASPASLGTTITFTGSGSGGSGTYEFEFVLKLSTDTIWTTVQAYSSSNVFVWNTSTGYVAGIYNVAVHVRNVGSSAAYEASATVDYTLSTSGSGGCCGHHK
jgi:hypothetical protein